MTDESSSGLQDTDASLRARVCAVIVTYNIGDLVHRCFDSIRNQVGHVLIVDNGSDETTRLDLQRLSASNEVSLILNEQNEGIARAFNQAVEWARDKGFQWILTMDHDSEATPGMVDTLLATFRMIEQQGTLPAGVVGANPFDQNVQSFFQYHPRAEGGMPLPDEDPISSGSLIPLKVFDVVGTFNEDLFVYHVDTEFVMRVKQKGFGAFVCPEAVLLHREGAKAQMRFLWLHALYDQYGKTARYYITRNTFYLIKNYKLSLTDSFWMIRRSCKDHLKILLFDRERFQVLLFSLHGLIDGIRGKMGRMDSVD